MSRINLTEQSDQELSLLVFNDEDLYNMRKRKDFIDLLRVYFVFTDAQLKVLEADLAEDSNND